MVCCELVPSATMFALANISAIFDNFTIFFTHNYFAIFLIRAHFSRFKKAKTLLKKYGCEISDNEKYELDRDIFNSNYIRLWPRQIVGISVKNVVRLDSKRILGNAFLKYGDRRNSLLEGELITVLCAINNKKKLNLTHPQPFFQITQFKFGLLMIRLSLLGDILIMRVRSIHL